MSAFRSWRLSALTIVFGLAASAARAEMITPDSIPNPPSAVGSASGTPVADSNNVGNQYAGLGLNFLSAAAITHLNGNSVWVSVGSQGLGGPVHYPLQMVSYGGMNAGFVSPGTSNPTTVSSFSVEMVGNQPLSMSVYGLNGVPMNITPIIHSLAGSQEWTFTGPGISSFSVEPTTTNSSPWGISGVSVTAASTPEPSSLILAGLGALGLAARFGWRRVRTVA